MKELRLPLRDRQGEKAVLYCAACGGEVYRGEPVFDWEGRRLCVDCFKTRVDAWLESSPVQVAAALGFDCEQAQ